MENGLLIIAAGILTGLSLSGVFAAFREELRRQRRTIEKTRRMIVEIEGLLLARR